MPPRVVQATDVGHGPRAWYESLPPITRAYGTVLAVLALSASFKMITGFYLVLIWQRVFSHFEVWRPLTTFLFGGRVNLTLIFHLVWLVTYGKVLETQVFQFQPADYLFMLLFGAASILAMGAVLQYTVGVALLVNAAALIFMVMYVWSRHFPDQVLSIWGLFTIKAFYLPFFYVLLDYLVTTEIPWGPCLGIAAGHLYFYLEDLYPAMGGPRLLRTPQFLKNLLADWGVGRRTNTHAAPGQDAFRAFQGRGQRLGAS
ncbi:hypothetical protein VOLCADRAFT_82188 [Volvox carteri f. nagariensis]|uniref:Derlin n=1 Tax=Volvox carteri f. nagariensis TaxID=3068 RepID=D8U489_VOLCA|nr:uncharacterized protein VOLCADRAFT_82188 [Volvox carteri f. nagariensis]EFJ45460.1 hypothetical protein VOLCADRAFT_82188 [Volvox carteri f. nagariensis]|eukprot:XP_002953487.1 hypothetical protein VOLCADRAFT_82188 [Volvox carteri f. nagariensis]